MTPRRLYLIRHGATDWNAERRLQGQRDSPLNDRGRAQSARCSDILRALLAASGRVAEEFAFISSPLYQRKADSRGHIGYEPRLDCRSWRQH